MTDTETIEQRLSTLERALSDGEAEFERLATAGELTDRLETVEAQLDELEETVAELEATTQALRGYMGNVKSVNEAVEQRAETALAKVERMESRTEFGGAPPDVEPAGETKSPGTASQGHYSGSTACEKPETGTQRESVAGSATADGRHRSNGPEMDGPEEADPTGREDQESHGATTCQSCGRPTSRTHEVDPRSTATAPDTRATEWAREVGDGPEPPAADARTDGGDSRTRNRQRDRGGGTGQRESRQDQEGSGDDGGLLAVVRDALE